SQLAAQRFARSIELPALTPDTARPRVTAQRVDHGAADAALCESLKLNAAVFVETVRGVDQPEHSVLDKVADINGIRHRCRHPAGQRFDERQAGNHTTVLTGGSRLGAHPEISLPRGFRRLRAIAMRVPTAEPSWRIAARSCGILS